MARGKLFNLLLLTLGLNYPQALSANCLNYSADTRLTTFCLANTLVGNKVALSEALLLDTLLRREGYPMGIGLPNRSPKTLTEKFIVPMLEYNGNVNGGNPNRPLVLGGLTLTGDREYLRKESVVFGLGAGLSGRTIAEEGRYLDYSVSASYAHSPKHRMGIKKGSAKICSHNLVSNNWFVDICGDTIRVVRDLNAETTSGASLSTSKLFRSGKSDFHSFSAGMRRHFAEDYTHNQIQFEWSTVRLNGVYSALNVSFGDAVQNKLAIRRTVSATLGTSVLNRPFTATVEHTHSDGGVLLGVARNDNSYSISINYALNSKIRLGIGYKIVESSINYFNEKEPQFTVSVAPLRF